PVALALLVRQQIDRVQLARVRRIALAPWPARGEPNDLAALIHGDVGECPILTGQNLRPAALALIHREAGEMRGRHDARIGNAPRGDVDLGDGARVGDGRFTNAHDTDYFCSRGLPSASVSVTCFCSRSKKRIRLPAKRLYQKRSWSRMARSSSGIVRIWP